VRPYFEKTHYKKAGRVVQGVGPEFKPQYHKKKKMGERKIFPFFNWPLHSYKNRSRSSHLQL
jgi:hypothetical protein